MRAVPGPSIKSVSSRTITPSAMPGMALAILLTALAIGPIGCAGA